MHDASAVLDPSITLAHRERLRPGRGGRGGDPADLLVVLVRIIDRRVVAVRDTLKAAAANTADAALIPQVAGGVEAVLAEGLQHHLFLGRVLGKVKS